jgi:GAF domain-containing protein
MAIDPAIPLEAVAALSAHLLEHGTLDEILRHVCETTVEHIPGADEASVTLLTTGAATTFGATSGLPIAADERQYEADTGPCLNAAQANQVVIVDDARTDKRWGDVLPKMANEGVLSSLSVPLPVQGTAIGALNIYGRQPSMFGSDSAALGEQLASFAAVAVANAVSYAKVSEDARNMQLAMESRAEIEQAKGIIMGRVGCDADTAFQLLVEQSQHENRKLRWIASELVDRAKHGGA